MNKDTEISPFDSWRRSYDALAEIHTSSLQEIEKLKKEIETLNFDLELMKDDLASKSGQLLTYREELKTLKKNVTKLKDSNNLLQREKFELYSINIGLEKDNKFLTEQVENIQTICTNKNG